MANPVRLDIQEMPQPPTAYRWYAQLFTPCATAAALRDGEGDGGRWATGCNLSMQHVALDVLRIHDRACGCTAARDLEYRYGYAKAG